MRPGPIAIRRRAAWAVISFALLLVGSALLWFTRRMEFEAMRPLPGGGYGEGFGPVSVIRWPMYLASIAIIVGGILFLVRTMWRR